MAAAERRELVDARGTVLRVSRHTAERAVVLSIWREGRCLGTFHAPEAQVAELFGAIEWATPSDSSYGASRSGALLGASGLAPSAAADTVRGVLTGAPLRRDLTGTLSPRGVLARSGASAGLDVGEEGDLGPLETGDGRRSAGSPLPSSSARDGSPGLREAARDLDEALRALEAAALSVGPVLLAGSQGPVSPADATVSPADATVSPADATVSPADATVSPADATVSPADATVSAADATVLLAPVDADAKRLGPAPRAGATGRSGPSDDARSRGATDATQVMTFRAEPAKAQPIDTNRRTEQLGTTRSADARSSDSGSSDARSSDASPDPHLPVTAGPADATRVLPAVDGGEPALDGGERG